MTIGLYTQWNQQQLPCLSVWNREKYSITPISIAVRIKFKIIDDAAQPGKEDLTMVFSLQLLHLSPLHDILTFSK